MKQQTAVEWLVEKLMKGQFINSPDELIQQALAMEKEQIIDAANQNQFEDIDGLGISDTITKGEQYYNETYQ